MKFNKPLRILFFVDGMAPTPADLKAASAINAQVMFRNARAVPADGCLEDCDGVAGDHVPPRYVEAFPSAELAIEARSAELAKLSELVGDSPAPAAPQAPAKAASKAAKADAAPKAGDGAQPAADAASGAGDADPATQPAPGADAQPNAVWKAN